MGKLTADLKITDLDELKDVLEQLQQRITELERENSALINDRVGLATHVEQLKNAGNEVYAELQHWYLLEYRPETDAAFKLWRHARMSTPQTCLAERDFKTAKFAFIAGADAHFMNFLSNDPALTSSDIRKLAEQYANQLHNEDKSK